MTNDNTGAVNPAPQAVAPVQPASASPAPSQEEMIPKSQVESIIHGRLKDQERKWEEKLNSQQKAAPETVISQQQSTAPLSKEQLEKEFEEFSKKRDEINYRAFQQQQEHQAIERAANELQSKFKAAEAEYPDFKEVVPDEVFTDPAIAHLAILANEFDNSADIMYDLLSSSQKIGAIKSAPLHTVKNDLKRLSAALKANKNGSSRQMPREPLSKLTSSNVPAKSDNGSKGAAYYRSKWVV